MSFWKTRTARKHHRCEWGCGEPIEPGTVYVYGSLPPWAEGNESPHWFSGGFHGRDLEDCPGRQRAAERRAREAMYT